MCICKYIITFIIIITISVGVACSFGAEKIAHGLRACIENHWLDDDFVVLKVDMKNAFNMVSRQALLSECSTHFPELLTWASWCYSQHPIPWHPLGRLRSEQGVQQGDPLGFLPGSEHPGFKNHIQWSLCRLVLPCLVHLDDGVLAGPRSAVLRALTII